MDFFERQRRVRGLSRRLVLLFLLAVVAIVVVIDVAAILGFGWRGEQLVAGVGALSVTVVLLIGLTSLVRVLLLRRGGGGAVARRLGGVYVAEDTTDPALRRLRNVAEEMAIASSLPVPEIYVLPDETGINAFAAGWTPADAAIAVTRGALDRLNRDELQGVVAHEFSHVANGDMRLNVRLIGLLAGIVGLSVVGRWMTYARGDKAWPVLLAGLGLVVLGWVGVFFGRLIKAAVSRQREYLADASAVQYTRQTSGLAGALKKIGGLPDGSTVAAGGRVEDVSHMLFGEGMRLSSWFATHPPLPERIRELEPAFDSAELDALRERWAAAPPHGLAEDDLLGFAARDGRRPRPPDGPVRLRPDEVVARVANPDDPAHRRAAALLAGIPEPVLARARRPDTVVALVHGLLLAADPRARASQLALLAGRHGRAAADAADAEARTLAGLPAVHRLPLAEVAFSALRRRGRPELEAVAAGVEELVGADGRVDVFEYCLSRLLHRELHDVSHRPPVVGARRRTMRSAREAVGTLLACLARAGHAEPRRALAAYTAGAGYVLGAAAPGFAPPAAVVGLDPVWPVLDALGTADTELLVRGLVAVIAHDGVTTVAEAELLRTVCALLHCPLPPLVGVPEPQHDGRTPVRSP